MLSGSFLLLSFTPSSSASWSHNISTTSVSYFCIRICFFFSFAVLVFGERSYGGKMCFLKNKTGKGAWED